MLEKVFQIWTDENKRRLRPLSNKKLKILLEQVNNMIALIESVGLSIKNSIITMSLNHQQVGFYINRKGEIESSYCKNCEKECPLDSHEINILIKAEERYCVREYCILK